MPQPVLVTKYLLCGKTEIQQINAIAMRKDLLADAHKNQKGTIREKWLKQSFFLLLLFNLLALLSSFYFPGDPILLTIRQQLFNYHNSFPQERAYVQFNKEQYQPGEIILFKGCLLSASRPSAISKIVYVELFNKEGLILEQLMLPVTEGCFNGEIALPDKLEQGDCFLRAYTAWMANFKSSLFFYKQIRIATKTILPASASATKNFSIDFFPEGGNLVEGLTSLVAFKATGPDGLPLQVSGKIINSFGATVAVLSSGKNGLGSFIMHHSPGIQYTAVVAANGMVKKVPLPFALKSGIVLHVERHCGKKTDTAFFNLSRSKADKDKYQNLVICAEGNGQSSLALVHFADEVAGNPMDTILNAPSPLLAGFNSGILHLSVLNQSGEVLARRMIFLHGQDKMNCEIKMEGEKPDLNTGGKNNFTLDIPAAFEGSAISVSVTEAVAAPRFNENELLYNDLLLSSNLDEYLSRPGLYFENADPSLALDLFLLTGKSGMPDPGRIARNDFPSIHYQPEQSIALRGRAYQSAEGQKKELLKNGALLMIIKNKKDSSTRLLNAFTDSLGKFAITGLNFNDGADIFVQTGERSGRIEQENISVECDEEFADSIRQTKFVTEPFLWKGWNGSVATHFRDSILDEERAEKQMGMLRPVTVGAKMKTHEDSLLLKYATGVFANKGTWARTMDFTNDEIARNLDINILEYLNGKVAGLEYRVDHLNNRYLIYWRLSNFMSGLTGPEQLKLNAPSFFLNEKLLNVGNEGYDQAIDLLSNIRMRDVAMVRIFQPGMNPIVPDNGPHGSIAIYLKNGTEENKPPSQVSFKKFIKYGYGLLTNDHHTAKNNFKGTDNLSHEPGTVYWMPTLKVDRNSHTATFSFQHNAISKGFRIIAWGLDKNGMVISLNKIIE